MCICLGGGRGHHPDPTPTQVDGVELKSEKGETAVSNMFAMLGSNQVFPCLCMAPLDEEPPCLESEPPKQQGEGSKKKVGRWVCVHVVR